MNILIEELDFIVNGNPYHDELGKFASTSFSTAIANLNKMSVSDIISAEKRYDECERNNDRAQFIKDRFNDSPKIIHDSDEDIKKWEKLSNKNYEEIYRSVEKSEYAKDYAESGQHIGDGRHGTGHYFFNNESNAESYNLGFEDRKVIIGKIRKRDVINEKEIKTLREKYEERAFGAGIDDSRLSRNDGAVAALLGAKAIRYEDSTVLVIDRGATTILKASVYNKLSSIIINELDFIFNGGKGSGNPNPGQGRGVGKPSGGISSLSTINSAMSQLPENYHKTIKKYAKDIAFYAKDLPKELTLDRMKERIRDEKHQKIYEAREAAFKELGVSSSQNDMDLYEWSKGNGPRDADGNYLSQPSLERGKKSYPQLIDRALLQQAYKNMGKETITLYRGELKGKKDIEKGYSSFTYDQGIAKTFSKGGNVRTVKVPIERIVADDTIFRFSRYQIEQEVIVEL